MRQNEILVFGVGDFVALVNQTLEYAYPNIYIEGEISNFKVSKNRWVYFDLKDNAASVRCFMTVYQLRGLFEDGMHVRVQAVPKLHQQYGFSLTVQQMQPVGEGAIKRAADMLKEKLALEGMFAVERKRSLPFPPRHIALIASRDSAAYGDFIKVLGARWGGVVIDSYDVQVQGEAAPESLLAAIANAARSTAEILVVTRGGGSSDDLLAFDDERVVRAIAGSRIPTIVAIGHERDESLSELVADVHASTPSNAAELLVPDKREITAFLAIQKTQLNHLLQQSVRAKRVSLHMMREQLHSKIQWLLHQEVASVAARKLLLEALHPSRALQRGYALVRHEQSIIHSAAELSVTQKLTLHFADGRAHVTVTQVDAHNNKEIL